MMSHIKDSISRWKDKEDKNLYLLGILAASGWLCLKVRCKIVRMVH